MSVDGVECALSAGGWGVGGAGDRCGYGGGGEQCMRGVSGVGVI